MVLRDGSQRLYVQQDANWNVTGIVSSSGAVQERYVYDPYGKATVYDPVAWTVRGSGTYGTSSFGWVYLHQGGRYTRFDDLSGLYYFRNRDLSPTLGRWMEEDPIGYDAGDSNLYGYEYENPGNSTDDSGLQKGNPPRPGPKPPSPKPPKDPKKPPREDPNWLDYVTSDNQPKCCDLAKWQMVRMLEKMKGVSLAKRTCLAGAAEQCFTWLYPGH
jgi:RHS repeat-associated protein